MTSVIRHRYRLRTWLRGHLPASFAVRLPKGSQHCGDHEWYRSDEATWRCYHCDVGSSHVSPFSDDELAGRLAALKLRLGALAARPLDEATQAELSAVVHEASSLLDRNRRPTRA
ncbi:MAG: hypothetical protein ACRDSE_12150 [Pseudonocardiaceae bacterium]